MVFTALHGMQTRSNDENSVCPSVRLSVKCVICAKTEERSVQILAYMQNRLTNSQRYLGLEGLVGLVG